jgi:hypothetical protein
MTTTTQTIRDQGVMVVESDVPAELTLREYRARRTAAKPRRKRIRGILARRVSR